MRRYLKKKNYAYHQYKIISVLLVIISLFFISAAFALESSVYDTMRNRMISARSSTSGSDNIIAINVRDSSGNLVDPQYLAIVNNPENIITNSLDENFSLSYAPTSAKAYISYTDTSDIHDVVVIDLSPATSPSPQLSVFPSSLPFPDTDVGSSSSLQIIAVANSGDGQITVTGMTGPLTSHFSIINNCISSVLGNGDTCTISATFTPQSAGFKSDSITIITDNGGSDQVQLSGTGQSPESPQISVNPSTLNLSTVTVDNFSTGNVTVTNIGTASLTVASVSSFTPSVFTLNSNGCTSPIAPGNNCNISVRFTPAASTTYNGGFTIQSDGGNQTVSLSGTGQSGPPPATNVSLAWGAPTTNEDGSPLTDLAGFVVYYGTSPASYSGAIDVGNVTGATIDNLSPGTWCFAVKAHNTSENESDFSNEVCKNIQ